MDRKLVEDAVQYTKKYVHGDFVDNPVTIQQKLAHIKIFRVTDDMTMCADKLALKKYARSVIGEDLCPETIEEYDDPFEVDAKRLPTTFVLKCNHGCGYNIIHNGTKPFEEWSSKMRLSRWLATNYARVGYELQYDGINRKCYAEEYVGDLTGVKDYKFSCFNGRPVFCQVISGRGTKAQHMNYYDSRFNYLDLCRMDFPNNPSLRDERPSSFDRMMECSEMLSKPFDYVRCDFYEKNGRLYLGEMTFTPGNARMKYKGDPETSFLLGAMIRISDR